VKSMAGEQLQAARLTSHGIEGDRIIQVRNAQGRTLTSRTHPGLLGFHASLDAAGAPLIDGRPWNDPAVLTEVRKIVGQGAHLVHNESLDRFDILPLLVATDGSISAFGRDRRRLRPNIVVGGVKGLAEREWEGGQLIVGEGQGSSARIQIEDLRGRCIMTTFDPDTLAHDPNVLRDIVRRFGGKLALNCDVIEGGVIQVNQEVRVLLPGEPATE
jgi:uncharacterized protein